MKKLIVFGIIVGCIVLMYQYPHAMLNPGELVEGHQKLNDKCLSCHSPFWGISNDKCISCHKLSEIGKEKIMVKGSKDATNHVLFHQHLTRQQCTSCHTDHKGLKPERSLSRLNHDMLPATMIRNCNSCHAQPSDNLHKQLSTSCNHCHSTKDWELSVTFKHDMIVGNAKNNCTSCHPKPGDSFHQQTKDNCNKCHSTNRWKPSTFDHSLYFQLDRDHNVSCTTCHTNNNYSTYTCYGCHEHSESKLMEEHNEHGIYNFNNCVSCHRNSNEHDIRTNENSNQKVNQDELNNMKEYIKTQEKEDKNDHHKEKEHDDD